MSIPFRCVECADSYEVEDELSGKTIRCRECHGFNRVPCAAKTLEPPPSTLFFPALSVFAAGLLCVVSGISLWLVVRTRDNPSPSPPINTPLVVTKSPLPSKEPRPVPVLHPRNFESRQQQDEWARQEEAAETERQRQIEAAEQKRQVLLQQELARVQRQMEIEKERQQKAEQEFALLSPPELQLALSITRKIDQNVNWNLSEIRFAHAHWIAFDTPKVRTHLLKTATQLGLQEVCENLNILLAQQEEYALQTLFAFADNPKGAVGLHTLLSVSRSYKRLGAEALPVSYKRYIREHPGFFPGIAP